MKFTLTVKQGLQTLAVIDGLDRRPEDIVVADLQKAIGTEQYLERLFGLRFHISSKGE